MRGRHFVKCIKKCQRHCYINKLLKIFKNVQKRSKTIWKFTKNVRKHTKTVWKLIQNLQIFRRFCMCTGAQGIRAQGGENSGKSCLS